MSQSLTQLFVHLIFSTKNRKTLINDAIRSELHAYTIGILRHYDCLSIITNAVDDHIHILFLLSKNHALADIVEEVKKGTSRWLKTKSPLLTGFYWQNGYGAFSVSQSDVDAVKTYIADQNEHHKHVTFEEELLALFRQFGIQINERYILD